MIIASGRFYASTFEFSNLKGCTAEVDSSVEEIRVTLNNPLPVEDYIVVVEDMSNDNVDYYWKVYHSADAPHVTIHVWSRDQETSNCSFRFVVLANS